MTPRRRTARAGLKNNNKQDRTLTYSSFDLDLVLWIAAAVLVVLIGAGVAVRFARQGKRRVEIERLKDDLHGLLASPKRPQRLTANGRLSDFVDIAASVNRLVERAEERGAAQGQAGSELYGPLFDTIPDIALVHDAAILHANTAAGDLLGLEPAALIGKPVTDLLRPSYRDLLRKFTADSFKAAEARTPSVVAAPLEVQLIGGDEPVWAELHSRRITYDGRPAMLTIARDISLRRSMESALGRSKLQARITLESIGEGVITTDREGVIDYMNEAAEQLIGSTRSFAIGKKLSDMIALIDEVERTSLGDPVAQCLGERRRVNLGRRALLMSKVSDREFSTELTASPIRGPDREIAGSVVIFHDVSEMRGLAREMSYQATHDALTGLVNRAEFERRLEGALKSARADAIGHVVCYLDLDRFKIVNDTCGHIAGDNLLRELATLVKQKVRDSDTVARVGGDEFAMLLIGCPLDKARQIADEVCNAIAGYHFSWQDRVFDIGVSIGMVEVGHESVSAETVLSAADSACYAAKQQGRGRVHVYSARDETRARERGEIQWLQRLQRALKENRFELHLQPIIALNGRVPNGPAVEVLIRMLDETGQRIAPAQFLGAAERYQLMSHIDRWVVQATLTAIASGALHLPRDRTCNVNLSAQTMADEDFLGFVVEVLDHTGVDPARLCFEVRESAVINNLEHAQRFIGVLHGMGCRFALDNFGSGVGSFANLKRLSLDYLKIDGVYTRDLAEDGVNREMVSAMIKMARSLDFRVVAEQIEDHAALETARDLGVDFVQGFIVERPRPIH